ncbi:uncharacterized protein BO97DRAFT_422677 [Aspergillus homomorphus CBS 101889]|uniref:F-box domain-containing protein n=1 Tax=Aspergillus homomorphus (strain CBS 101889) TaxID=1450537 RepID=A0A395I3F2_ASPHC|nr:hypothetical protein BO97DRAFT_422677 [Aspergillus homomorphus CBS 101889]RAL14246.1 hypothetical protein BO97DRAFT_422677 [Aspergillus homomorphus CBS 101889]
MSAIERTGLPVQSLESLDVFAEGYNHRRGSPCSISFSEFTAALSHSIPGLAISFQQCRTFCLSLGHHIQIEIQGGKCIPVDTAGLQRSPSRDQSSLQPAASLSHLEELYLAWEYNDLEETAGILDQLLFFNHVAGACIFPHLKRCTFINLRMSETALMTFFRGVPRLTHLTMDHIFLRGEYTGYTGLFELLSTTMLDLDCLRLRSLYSSSGMQYPDELKQKRWDIHRTGADAKRLVVAKAI